MAEIPGVRILENIKPVNAGTGESPLVYAGLIDAVEMYRTTHVLRAERVWEDSPGSLDELSHARQLASEYLLRTAQRTINAHPGNRDTWADRFTTASIELYGAPEKDEVATLLAHEYHLLTQLEGDETVSHDAVQTLLDAYRPFSNSLEATKPLASPEQDKEKQAIQQYGEAIREHYQPLFDLVDATEKDKFDPVDLKELLSETVAWLCEHDDTDWQDWTVVYKEGNALSVNAKDRQIKVGRQREAASPSEARALIAHEVLVHALRAKNGYRTGDKKLATGLAGYLDAEEGLGILAEEAITGELPAKAYDRYVDIALALGVVDGVQRTRQQLFEISHARQLIRKQLQGSVIVPEDLAASTWTHVDRIYRGGPGDDVVARQAIFTKDIAYYTGYKQVVTYIAGQLEHGMTAAEVFEFLSQAKFDPTNPRHLERLASPQQ